MSKKDKNMDRMIMKHVFEVRLKNRIFSFLDFKGEMVDFLIKELKGESIRISQNGTRVDIASKDLSHIFFFSLENFGLQIEASDSFEDFKDQISKLFKILKSFPKYKFDSVIRIGTKSSILYHKSGDNFDGIKQIHIKKIFPNYSNVETNTSSVLSDVTYIFDLKKDNGTANVMLGPAKKDEVINKFFGEYKGYKSFPKDNGSFFQIDFAKNSEKESNLEDLENDLKDNVDSIKIILDGFVSYLSSSQ